MNVCFYQSDKDREALIALAFCEGANKHGHRTERRLTKDYEEPDPKIDMAVVFGVKGHSKRIMNDHLTLGKRVVYIDKGYITVRAPVGNRLSRAFYYKVSLDGFQPLKYLDSVKRPGDRWETLQRTHGNKLHPWRRRGRKVVWLGPSQKYCDFHNLGDAHEYSSAIIRRLNKRTTKPIVYRPKHSWTEARSLPGAVLSQGKRITEDLEEAWAFATHGSNSSVQAILHGIPVLVFGPAITDRLAEHDIERLDDIACPSYDDRLQWLFDICYWQWTMAEMHEGQTWNTLRKYL